jgi:hypothetical protein
MLQIHEEEKIFKFESLIQDLGQVSAFKIRQDCHPLLAYFLCTMSHHNSNQKK